MSNRTFCPQYSGHFAGFASTFNIDAHGDQVVKGAFIKSIKTWETLKQFPVLCINHQQKCKVGEISKMIETDQGLYVEGRVTDSNLRLKL